MKTRLFLRAFEPDDYKTTINWRNDTEIWNMVVGTKYYVSEAYEKRWTEEAINNTSNIRLAICLNINKKHIGNIYITNIDLNNRSGRTAILIGEKEYWGKGYGTEAMNLLLAYAFEERNLHRIEAFILENNAASIKAHIKAGYKQEGVLRQAVFKNGKW